MQLSKETVYQTSNRKNYIRSSLTGHKLDYCFYFENLPSQCVNSKFLKTAFLSLISVASSFFFVATIRFTKNTHKQKYYMCLAMVTHCHQ